MRSMRGSMSIRSRARKLAAPRSGQSLVLFALLSVVLIGFIALGIDLGMAYSQRRFMQNAVDAAALAATNQLANNLQGTSDGSWTFLVKDQNIRDTVKRYIDANSGITPPGASYGAAGSCSSGPFCIEYLNVNKSLLDKSPTSNGQVPSGTAIVRVSVKRTYSTFLATVLGRNKMSVGATAAARIFPVSKPQYPPTGVWPMTRKYTGNALTEFPTNGACPPPVVFWSPNDSGSTVGDFKGLFYVGKYSAYVQEKNYDPSKKVAGTIPNHVQMITEFISDNNDPYGDTEGPPANLNGSDVHDSLVQWFRNGLSIKLTAGSYLTPPSDANDEPTTPSYSGKLSSWQINRNSTYAAYGDKVEVITGNLGNNISDAMKEYVHNHVVGKDSCGGNYALVAVYLWDKAETFQSSKSSTQRGKFVTLTGSGGDVNRVSLRDWRIYRFYDPYQPNASSYPVQSFTNSSEIRGYFPSVSVNAPPQSGNPSPFQNTVRLID